MLPEEKHFADFETADVDVLVKHGLEAASSGTVRLQTTARLPRRSPPSEILGTCKLKGSLSFLGSGALDCVLNSLETLQPLGKARASLSRPTGCESPRRQAMNKTTSSDQSLTTKNTAVAVIEAGGR